MAAQWQININSDTGVSPPRVTFDPSQLLEVEPGDQIFWTNNDSEPHWPGLKKQLSIGSVVIIAIDTTFFMPNQIAGNDTSSTFSPGVAEMLEYVCSICWKAGTPCSATGTIVVENAPENAP